MSARAGWYKEYTVHQLPLPRVTLSRRLTSAFKPINSTTTSSLSAFAAAISDVVPCWIEGECTEHAGANE